MDFDYICFEMNSKINFQILIATMDRENLDFLYKMFPFHKLADLDIIIVNQTTKDKTLVSDIATVTVINSLERGISNSRNLALKNATSDWCLIADDDLEYVANFEKIISEGISKYPKSGLISFEVVTEKGELFNDYPVKSMESTGVFTKMNLTSFEILLNRKEVFEKGVTFNTNFGLGSGKFYCGEEFVLVREIECNIRKKVSFYKGIIVQHPWLNTGRKFCSETYYITKGAIYAKAFPRSYSFWIMLQLLFDLKQHKIKLNHIFRSIKQATKGVRLLKSLEKNARNDN